MPPRWNENRLTALRHSREMTLLCSPKVAHHHCEAVAFLPAGKRLFLRPGKSLRTFRASFARPARTAVLRRTERLIRPRRG